MAIHFKQSVSIFTVIVLIQLIYYLIVHNKVQKIKEKEEKTPYEVNLISRYNGVFVTMCIFAILAVLDQLGLLRWKK